MFSRLSNGSLHYHYDNYLHRYNVTVNCIMLQALKQPFLALIIPVAPASKSD